jgi:transmembrane sensor
MPKSEEDIRAQAAAWFARLRAPDGEKDRTAFDSWRNADSRHAAAYDRVSRRWQLNARLAESPIARRTRLRPSAWRRAKLDRPGVFMPMAAVLAIAVFFGVRGITVSENRSGAASQFASATGQIRTVSLPDGSRVTLDTASSVTQLYTAGERRVRLDRGRARFDVVHNADRPFVVTVGSTRIMDLGTVFDVRKSSEAVEVALLRGQVEVRETARVQPAVTLLPGDRLVIPARLARPISRVAGQAAPAWVTGMLDFRDVPLPSMLAEINRYSTRRVLLGDNRLASLRVTGAFKTSAPDDLAASLAALFKLRTHKDEHGNLILEPDDVSPSRPVE